MSNLTRFDGNGIELVINTETGESFATVSGYSRMGGLSRQAIDLRLKGCKEHEVKFAEILTSGGLQKAKLISMSHVFTLLSRQNKPEVILKIAKILTDLGLPVPEYHTLETRKPSKKAPKGYIYMFATVFSSADIITYGANMVKVGFSANPINRFKSISEVVPTPMAIVAILKGCTLVEELAFHKAHKFHLVKNEWYPGCVSHDFNKYFAHKENIIDHAKFTPYRFYVTDGEYENELETGNCDRFGVYYS